MGRQIKRLQSIAAAVIIALTLTVWISLPVYASDPPAPSNLQLETVRVYHNLLEDDDFLLVAHYNIHYNSGQPSTPANKLFIFRLLDTNGVDYLGSVVPYASHNSGYDQGVFSLYFSATDAPTWEDPFVLKISGNPEYYASPPVVNYFMVTSDYCQMDTTAENQTMLGTYIIGVAHLLETNWSTTLTYMGDLGSILNSIGESYFRGAITGLTAFAPQVFAVQITNPDYTEGSFTEAQAHTYENRFANTWVGEGLVNAATQLHIKWNVITGLGALILIVLAAWFCQKKYETTKPALGGAPYLLLGGGVLGFISWAIIAIVGVFCALFLGYVWMHTKG
jgi:hypothetical protein